MRSPSQAWAGRALAAALLSMCLPVFARVLSAPETIAFLFAFLASSFLVSSTSPMASGKAWPQSASGCRPHREKREKKGEHRGRACFRWPTGEAERMSNYFGKRGQAITLKREENHRSHDTNNLLLTFPVLRPRILCRCLRCSSTHLLHYGASGQQGGRDLTCGMGCDEGMGNCRVGGGLNRRSHVWARATRLPEPPNTKDLVDTGA